MTTIVSHSIGRSVYSLLLPAITDEFSLSNSQAGWPSSGTFVLYVVGVLTVVVVSPRVEPITIMRASLALSAVGLVIAATAPGIALLTAGVSLAGGAGAGIWMTAPVLATEYVSEHRRGVVIGALTSTIGLANIMFGIGTSTWRRTSGDEDLWRPIWWVALGVTTTLLVALVAIGRFAKTDRLGSRTLDLSIITRIRHWKQVTLAYALFGGMSAGFSTFIFKALQEHGGFDKSVSPVLFSLMGIVGMIAAPLAGALSDRIGRLKVMRGALLVLVIANLLGALGGGAVLAGALIYSAGASSFPALIAAHVRDTLDSRSFSQALAIMTILFSVMAAILPTLVGVISDATSSFGWPYLLVATLPATAFVLLTSIRERAQGAL